MRRFVMIIVVLAILVSVGGSDLLVLPVVQADGFIDFENGVDGEPIRSSIPGLQFTTTEGYDWVYGDWRTGEYNGPYPDGSYYSNGHFFAWLGPNQGAGRIDFTQGCATYLQVWVSSAAGLTADAYYSNGALADTASVAGNLDTGRLARLRVEAPPGDCFSYVILHDTGNRWLIDDLSTDAGGVPATRPPVVLLPGLMGSQLWNNNSCVFLDYEVWPAPGLLIDPWDVHLKALLLAENGQDEASHCDHIYPADIIRRALVDFYGPIIDHLDSVGFEVHPFAYDWRLDLRGAADRLDDFVDDILADSESDQVNIVDHSLGGLLARHYVTSSWARAAKVEQVISVGTPFLGAPKALKALRWGDNLPIKQLANIGLVYAPRVKDIAQNSPAMYQILPTRRYFDVNSGGYYRVEGQIQNWYQTRTVTLADHNDNLVYDAENFHAAAMDDWGSIQLDVAYRLIVGTGQEGTIGELHEYTTYDWLGRPKTTWDIAVTNGDGTVPLHSADLKGHGYDYSGSVPIWYTNDLDHSALIKEQYVMDFIAALLASPPNSAAMTQAQASARPPDPLAPGLYRGSPDRFAEPKHHDTVPPTPPEMAQQPFALDGGQIAAYGAVALHVYDQSGNHTGPIGDDRVELGIPASGYIELGDAVFVSVPAGAMYSVKVESEGAEDFDLRFRNIQGVDTDLIRRTVTYADARIGPQGTAEVAYDPHDSGSPRSLAVDDDGDGRVDHYMPPTGDLGPGESTDMVAPTVTLHLDGQIGPHGWYVGPVVVTITAVDNQTGVAKVEYSADRGQNVLAYTGPFTVQAEQVSILTAQATDRAGNKGWATIRIGPFRTYVPISSSQTSNHAPNVPRNPSPPDGATNQSVDVNLSWIGGDPNGDTVTYDVYLEANDSTPDVRVSHNKYDTIYDPGTLSAGTHYYWQVIARDEHGATSTGTVWDFTTIPANRIEDDELVLLDGSGRIKVVDTNVPSGFEPVDWQSDTTGWTAVTLGDFNGDGDQEILATKGATAQIFDPVVQPGYAEVAGQWSISSPYVWYDMDTGDIDGDGRDEIVLLRSDAAGDILSRLLVYDGDAAGTSWTKTKELTHGARWDDVALGDVNADGKEDVGLIRPDDNLLLILNPAANWTNLHENAYNFTWKDLEMVNVEKTSGADKTEIALSRKGVLGELNSILVFRWKTGTALEDVWGGKFYPYFDDLEGADLNGDGDEELIMYRDTDDVDVTLIARNPLGSSMRTFEPTGSNSPHGGWLDMETGDIDGDGKDEVILVRSDKYRIYDRPEASDNFNDVSGSFRGSFAIGDLDGSEVSSG